MDCAGDNDEGMRKAPIVTRASDDNDKGEVQARIAKMIRGGLLLKFTSYEHTSS